ncbi:hypothetical protein [Microbacterium sp. No. 7]|uniref:hypothetical protein n=1 Tax=Microbacterium sp. No. 7 TaxID=1714373 RepID=UPI0006CF8DB5|nr:hypothetical protein [Microbacterium sp. No. 7]ALJ19878.1 UDP-N-acetylmuramyl pentapeptide phosphotransferase [Microbacterium sp. No. 7]
MSAASEQPQVRPVSDDPARRPDVLLRRRMPDGHQVSAWWMIGAFAFVTVGVVLMLNVFPAS